MPQTDTYRQFCERLDNLPLFLRPEWWDATAGPDRWNVALIEKGGQTVAALPYVVHRKLGLNTITQPPMTPYTGWLIDFPEGQKTHARQSFSYEMIGTLIQQLPKYARLNFRFDPLHQDLLPWIWAGAKTQVRYTYRLDIRPDEGELFEGLRDNLRRAVRSTEGWQTTSGNSMAADMLHRMKEDSYKSKGEVLPVGKSILQRVAIYLEKTNQGALLTTSPPGEEPGGVVLLACDRDTCVYLSGATSPAQRSSGASTRLLWEAIRFAKERGCTVFDFEGSMVPSIERYFRAFNGVLTPYFELASNRHILLKLREFWR